MCGNCQGIHLHTLSGDNNDNNNYTNDRRIKNKKKIYEKGYETTARRSVVVVVNKSVKNIDGRKLMQYGDEIGIKTHKYTHFVLYTNKFALTSTMCKYNSEKYERKKNQI